MKALFIGGTGTISTDVVSLPTFTMRKLWRKLLQMKVMMS